MPMKIPLSLATLFCLLSRIGAIFGSLNELISEPIMKDPRWIWQHERWPNFEYDLAALSPALRALYTNLGRLLQANQSTHTNRAVKIDMLLSSMLASSAIEGEVVSANSLRSSLAHRLNLADQQPNKSQAREQGLAELVAQVIESDGFISVELLCKWQSLLFSDHPLLYPDLTIGELRSGEIMQVVSGSGRSRKVHFEAPDSDELPSELLAFVDWFNGSKKDGAVEPVLRAGIAHLWFVTIHPFDDGNGRVCRAISDLALRNVNEELLFLASMSSSILENRSEYYRMLESTQRSGVEITGWLQWFVDTLNQAVEQSFDQVEITLQKRRFLDEIESSRLNEKQLKMINRLLDGDFSEGLSARHYASACKVSKATATRHLADLVQHKVLVPLKGGGRSMRYKLVATNIDL